MNQTLTICLITKNEGLNIKPFLASFSDLSNNFIIVDTGSTDETVSIAIEENIEVHHFDWCDDFSMARNFCLSKVKTPWVMMVDADQRISDESIKILKSCFKETSSSVDVFYLKSTFNNTSIFLPKIWRSNLNLKYIYPVHEYLSFEGKSIKSTNCEAIIENTPQDDYRKSRKKYISIMEKYITENGEDLHLLYYLVSDNNYLGDYQKVLSWAARYLSNNPQDDCEISRVLFRCASALINTGNSKKAKKILRQSIKLDSKNVESYLSLGDIFYKEGKIEQAQKCYKELINKKNIVNPNFYNNSQTIQQQAIKKLSSLRENQ